MGTSQSNEDAIIAEIFDRIGDGDKRFLEFGCGDGRQNNTIALLKRGWSGTWFEPHKRRCWSARERWTGYPVDIIRRVITAEKVNLVVKDPLDFLSIDIDGPDYGVWRAITARPRVVCIEYDADQTFGGASLEDMRWLGAGKDYYFHGTSASNVNAFFIHKDWM